MSTMMGCRMLVPGRDLLPLLMKWVVGLLVPVVVFTLWAGESIINAVIAPGAVTANVPTDPPSLIQAAVFTIVFYAAMIALAGYLVAADSGRRGLAELWIDILIFALIPLVLVIILTDVFTFSYSLIIGLALCALIWPVYLYVCGLIRKARNSVSTTPLKSLTVVNDEPRVTLMERAIAGSFWFSTAFAIVSLIVDLIFYFTDSLPALLLIWVFVRTLLLPVAGYFLGRLAGAVASRHTLSAKVNGNVGNKRTSIKRLFRNPMSREHQLKELSPSRAREEEKDLVPNDLPLHSTGAQRFYLTLLVAFVLFYPVLDPFLFGSGTDGRLASYGDAGFYIILALGLNVVVGFAGLLDLGYVAFFAIGSYAWGLVGSPQLGFLTGIRVDPSIWPWFFWPMLLGAALIAAFWGVVLGAPTLRLRGDYLAIVTLGFGEIVPVIFLELDNITKGANGLAGVYSPAFPGIDWSSITSGPYYYLILALIALTIFANARLRDSRLGRAWVAVREDEVAASCSGVNLVNTKLFAFGAGAFFSGIAGAYHAAKLGFVSPDNFSFGDSVVYLSMVVIGGIGSIPGVIVGAIAVYAINELILAQLDTFAADPGNPLHALQQGILHFAPGFTFGNIRNLIFGVILVAIMIFRPEGLIPSARRRRELHAGNVEEVEVGSLDVPPGAPGFESEVRVE